MENIRNVLFVENSLNDIQLILAQFELAGMKIDHLRVGSKNEMTAALRQNCWDLVIAGNNSLGFEAASALELYHQMGLNIPFIIVSDTISDETAIDLMKSGAHDYLKINQLIRLIPAIEREFKATKLKQESESRYNTLFNEMLEGFALHEIICDQNGKPVDYRFLNVNPAFEQITGLLASDLINKTVKEIFPETEPYWIERYGQVALTKIPARFVEYSQSLNKSYQVVAYCPKAGQFATIVTDISERIKSEAISVKHKRRLIRGESVSKSGNWELYVETGMISASEGAQKLYGLEGESWDFSQIKDIPLPEYRGLLDHALSQLINFGAPYDIEYKIKQLKSGRIIDIHSIAEYDPSEKVLFGVIQSITERKSTEEALLKSEEKYRLLIENQGEGVATVDLEEIFVFANSAADHMFGVPKGTLVGRNLFDFLIPHHIPRILEQTAKRAQMKKSSYEIEIITLKGEHRHLLVTATPQTNEDGIIVGTFGIFRDVTERINSEKELVNSEKRYRELANSLPVSVFETDLAGRLTFANTTAMDWFGYTEAEFSAGINIFQFVSPGESPRARERFSNIVAQDINSSSEYTVNRRDGSSFPVLASVFAVNKEGKITGVRGTLADISERKIAEKKLKLSEQNLTNLISNLPGFVYRCKNDKNCSMEYLSEGFSAITGYSVREFLETKKLTYYDIIHPDYRNHIWEQWQLSRPPGVLQEEEYPIITKSGEIRWVWERGRDIYNDDNNLVYMEGFISDITEKKRIEQVQKVLYDISTAVLTTQNLAELIEIIRRQLGKLLDTNNFYIALYDEVTGLLHSPYSDNQSEIPDSWQAEGSLTGYLIQQKKALLISEQELMALAASGAIQVFGKPAKLWLGIPLLQEEQIFGAIVVQSYDNPIAFNAEDLKMLEFISHQISLFILQKRSEEELQSALAKAEESNQLKSAFLAMMNHELRTPLTHILGFSELIMSGVSPEDNVNFASSIQTSGQSLLSIIEGVFDLALVEQTKIKLTKQTFSLMDHFMENRASFDHILRTSAKHEHIQLIFKPDTHWLSSYVTADRSKINQILTNLFKNAVKFTSEGNIEFGFKVEDESKLIFYIKDTGIGIPQEKQSLIFDYFRQGDDSYTRVYGGIGIGLAISRKIAKILNGELKVVSEPGEGSIFYLSIPVELSYIKE